MHRLELDDPRERLLGRCLRRQAEAQPDSEFLLTEDQSLSFGRVNELANASALATGADEVECTIDGRSWLQRPFPYQGKCLQWLRTDYAALDGKTRATVDAALAGSGCEPLFAD